MQTIIYLDFSSYQYCVKSFRILSFSLSVFSRIQSEYGDRIFSGVYFFRYLPHKRENTEQEKFQIWTLYT